MAKRPRASIAQNLTLPQRISAEVEGWCKQGYHPFPSETSRQLLSHWFNRDDETGEKFHPCQRRAIETVIYCHEVRGVRTLQQLFQEFAPELLNLSKPVADEVASIPFIKYCFKMATGSGKTWVLAALVVWQYFNSINGESNAPYSPRFLVVAPGVEVLNRLLDSFKGKRDPKTGNRDPQTSDYRRPLFMPDDAHWSGRFHLLEHVLEPTEIRSNTTAPDSPFIAVVNWQQFIMAKDEIKLTLAERMGLDIPEEPRGEIIADYLTEYPDLIILNDEAHHVHGKKTARTEELVWRKFMHVLDQRMTERHGADRGLFFQVDFSATPFYGSGQNREYFPHIVYDYDLRNALNDMLVKQLFVEERQKPPGQKSLEELDFRAERDDADSGKRGDVLNLSTGQKQIIDIGLSKLNQLAEDFFNKGLNRKPVLMILCEDTTVADLVFNHLLTCRAHTGDFLNARNVLLFHSELKKEKHGYTIDEARKTGTIHSDHPTLDGIDDDDDPLRIVVSVLALREGFDKTNICVIAVLRATEADLLLEQLVGRGLRLMFPDYQYPGTIQDAKQQAFEDLKNRRQPHNSLDFLYIVEHPRFRTFYDELRKQGYLIAAGDSTTTSPTGDLIPIDAAPSRLALCDIAWPLAVQEEARLPDLSQIPANELPSGTWDIDQVRQVMQSVAITDRHLETDTRAKTWKLRDRFFDFNEYLRTTANMIAKEGKTPVLTSHRAEIMALVDDYTTHRLFGKTIDFAIPDNYKVLAYPPIADFVVQTIRKVLFDMLGTPRYEVRRGVWRRLSDLSRISIRESASIQTRRCIYPRMGFSSRFGGLERDVMDSLLEGSGDEVQGWCKLQRKHGLTIAYRDPTGLLRQYEVDFIIRTPDACYLLETKADDELTHPTVGSKARAAKLWCESICGIEPPKGSTQPTKWEYLLLSESLFEANRGMSFSAVVPLARQLRDQVIAEQFHGSLFVS